MQTQKIILIFLIILVFIIASLFIFLSITSPKKAPSASINNAVDNAGKRAAPASLSPEEKEKQMTQILNDLDQQSSSTKPKTAADIEKVLQSLNQVNPTTGATGNNSTSSQQNNQAVTNLTPSQQQKIDEQKKKQMEDVLKQLDSLK